MNVPALRRYLDAHQGEMLASLEGLVTHESPSTEKTHLDALATTLAQRWRDLGAKASIVENEGGGNHVRVLVPSTLPEANARRPALILGHFDTVWPLGTLDRKPFTVDGARATGPGVYDMKGGLVIAEFAIRSIRDLNLVLPRPVVLVLNADEEIGSSTSRALIESEALKAAYVLVLEPAVPGGALKTARKGVGAFTLEVTGLASHAGSAPQEGVSAIEELARQILRLHGFTDYEVGTTVNVGVIKGGTRSNVVAARAWADIDTRAWTQDEARRIEAVILGLKPINPRTQVVASGGFERMPLERTKGTVALFETARRVGQQMGLDLQEGSSGGGSDGNFTSALGIPTLDGLGVAGDGAHAEHEYIEIKSLPERAAVVAGLLCEAGELPRS